MPCIERLAPPKKTQKRGRGTRQGAKPPRANQRQCSEGRPTSDEVQAGCAALKEATKERLASACLHL